MYTSKKGMSFQLYGTMSEKGKVQDKKKTSAKNQSFQWKVQS